MKKKNIIIVVLSALVLAGATVGAAYALDKGISYEVAVPDKAAVLVKDDPSIEISLDEALASAGVSKVPRTEAQKTYYIERAKVRSVISDVIAEVKAENPGLEEVNIGLEECLDMTKEQIKLYANLLAKEKNNNRPGSLCPRILAQAKGEMPLDAPRLTVEAVNEIISQSSDLSEMCGKIRERYGAPDTLCMGSGIPVTQAEYWLDDEKSQYIYIWARYDEGKIFLCNGEGGKILLCANENCHDTAAE